MVRASFGSRRFRLGALILTVAPVVLLAADQALRVVPLREIFDKGGIAMKWIALLSVLSLFLTFLYAFTMRQGTLCPKRFLRDAEDAAEEGDLEALRALCASNESPAARIIESAAEVLAGDNRVDYMVVRDALEDEGVRQAGALWQRIQYLQDIAVISPMLGLLGTVLGMMHSFAGLEAGVAFANKADALAAGVAEALYTTAAGLVVGILSMAIYAFFRGQVNRLVGGMENACNRVLRRYAIRQQVRTL